MLRWWPPRNRAHLSARFRLAVSGRRPAVVVRDLEGMIHWLRYEWLAARDAPLQTCPSRIHPNVETAAWKYVVVIVTYPPNGIAADFGVIQNTSSKPT